MKLFLFIFLRITATLSTWIFPICLECDLIKVNLLSFHERKNQSTLNSEIITHFKIVNLTILIFMGVYLFKCDFTFCVNFNLSEHLINLYKHVFTGYQYAFGFGFLFDAYKNNNNKKTVFAKTIRKLVRETSIWFVLQEYIDLFNLT